MIEIDRITALFYAFFTGAIPSNDPRVEELRTLDDAYILAGMNRGRILYDLWAARHLCAKSAQLGTEDLCCLAENLQEVTKHTDRGMLQRMKEEIFSEIVAAMSGAAEDCSNADFVGFMIDIVAHVAPLRDAALALLESYKERIETSDDVIGILATLDDAGESAPAWLNRHILSMVDTLSLEQIGSIVEAGASHVLASAALATRLETADTHSLIIACDNDEHGGMFLDMMLRTLVSRKDDIRQMAEMAAQ